MSKVKRERREEGDKRGDDHVERLGPREALGGEGVEGEEDEGGGQDGVYGQEGDDLGAAPHARDDQGVLEAVDDWGEESGGWG